VIQHIVMWSLKAPADAPRFKALLDTCKGISPGMLGFEVGIKTDGLEANVDVVLISSFTDAAALAAYVVHPAHQAVLGELGAMRASRHVLDFNA
jgi:quinol monooxygenase YgiN